MATKKRSEKKHATPLARALRIGGGVAAVLAAVTLFLTNLDTLNDLWRKYFGTEPIAELQSPRNLPSDLIHSMAPVRAELVQAADQEPDGRAYDLYLENRGPEDVLISEVRFGPGAAYASATDSAGASGKVLPTASYSVVATGGRGVMPLSPPYRLVANRNGAIRVIIRGPAGTSASRGTVAFQLYSSAGNKVASVNQMLGE